VAAFVVQGYVDRQSPPRLCVFPDTGIYWLLAQTIRTGEPYQVSLWGVPHFALRTPGYPLFLAACQGVFGERAVLPVRLVQAGLGAGYAWLVERLVRRVEAGGAGQRHSFVSIAAAALVAVDPYTVALSVLVLSEALFVPLMLAALWGLAVLWPPSGVAQQSDEAGRSSLVALMTGLAAGSAILVRPSWALFIPAVLLAWIVLSRSLDRRAAVRGALVVSLGVAIAMAPWWIRNARVFGRFIPSALWEGPSLYDGLNPQATGASDMRFLDDREIRRLDEETLDASLRSQAWAFARAHPARALELALIKTARFWSPWPNAETLRSPLIAVASAIVTLPIYALMIAGAWDRRRDLRALILLAGPLLYFWVLHTIFVGSIRYRIPAAVPALGLAAMGAERLLRSWPWLKPKILAPGPNLGGA
jgi:4-amino-4-deoxy-L-arabinose transferase-like glycosyltransferase